MLISFGQVSMGSILLIGTFAFAQEQDKSAEAAELAKKGNSLWSEGRMAEAREAYLKLLELVERDKKPPVLLFVARTYYKEAEAAKDKNDRLAKLGSAITFVKQALEIKPDDSGSVNLLAAMLIEEGRPEEALKYKNLESTVLLNAGILYLNKKNVDKALEVFNRAITENSRLAEAYYYRALAFILKGKKPEAKSDLNKLLELDPSNQFADQAREYLKSL